jgi:hypothetical protein
MNYLPGLASDLQLSASQAPRIAGVSHVVPGLDFFFFFGYLCMYFFFIVVLGMHCYIYTSSYSISLSNSPPPSFFLISLLPIYCIHMYINGKMKPVKTIPVWTFNRYSHLRFGF